MKVLVLLLSLIACINVHGSNKYSVEIDLSRISNDQLFVTIILPEIDVDSIEFHLPRIVPGTYSISDFGRFLSNLQAFDNNGNSLPVKKLTTNRWLITGNKLAKISYLIDDTFDFQTDNPIFEPNGTSLEEDRDVYLLNTYGFIGYLDGYKSLPYQIKIRHPKHIYGSTSLKRTAQDSISDTFIAENYYFLADAPIIYCIPDTISKNIAGAEILVSVYSPNRLLTAAYVMNNIMDLMKAQAVYMGGKLPVDRYAYLIYLEDFQPPSGMWGALEHSYSSLYTLPEFMASNISQSIRDIAAHEFLHIITPLNIHSEEISNFDFIEPKMSKHLWLYEGVTEYSSLQIQVRNKLFNEKSFLQEIRSKILNSNQYTNVSFTEMSEHILNDEYRNMFLNVYEKGALIAMCLDLSLLKYSNGKMDLATLMIKLSEKYGPMKSFDDNELFEEITGMTYPEIGVFFSDFVEGNMDLPLKEYLSWVGIHYSPNVKREVTSLGEIGIQYNSDNQVIVTNTENMNDFGVELGYQKGDVILSINNQLINENNIDALLQNLNETISQGDKVTLYVLREKNGEKQKIKLKGKAIKVTKSEPMKLDFKREEELSKEEVALKKWWLSGNK